jgi:hypothetical protein
MKIKFGFSSVVGDSVGGGLGLPVPVSVPPIQKLHAATHSLPIAEADSPPPSAA